MKIFVTGGAGFIGSHIVEYYLQRGDEVWVVDNLTTGTLDNLPQHPNLRFEKSDISQYKELRKVVQGADVIFHAAASVGMRNVLANPFHTLSNNLATTEALLRVITSKQKLIFLSSSGVYWNAKGESFAEDMPLIVNTQDYQQEAYSISKIAGEILALTAAKQKGFSLIVARIFNTIGVRQSGKYGMVVPRFISQALENKPITVYGDGKQTRSFINVHDTVEALVKLAQCDKKIDIVNVGNDRETSILELAQIVKEVTKSQSEFQLISYEEAFGFSFRDVENRRPAIEKLKELTGFSPKWALEQTIEEIVNAPSLQK